MAKATAKKRCPQCGERTCVPTAYGLPPTEMFEQARRGEIEEGAQLFTNRSTLFGPVCPILIDNHTDASVASFERNPPGPPSVPSDMVGSGATDTHVRAPQSFVLF